MTLSATGEALTPAGGSVCMRLKSLMRRRRAEVDMLKGYRWKRTRYQVDVREGINVAES